MRTILLSITLMLSAILGAKTVASAEDDFKQFFKKDSAYIKGYIEGYNPDAGLENSIISFGNNATGVDSPAVVNISPDGRFECKLWLNYPLENSFQLDDVTIPFYIEPGQTLTIHIDWNAISRDKRACFSDSPVNAIEYKGPSAMLSQMYRSLKESLMYPEELYSAVHTLTPDQFMQRVKTVSSKWDLIGDSLLQIYGTSGKAAHLLKNKLAIEKGNIIFYFLHSRVLFAQRDTTNQVLKIKSNDSHFNFLKDIPLDDVTMLADKGCRQFINQFEYMIPLQDIGNWEKIFNSGPNTNEEMDRMTLANEQEFMIKSDSIVSLISGQPKSFFWQASLVRRLQYVLKKYSTRDAAEKHIATLCNYLTHPMLIEESRRILEAVWPKEAGECYRLPESKATEIFRTIIKAHAGKVLFIDFWSTSCGPCKAGIIQSAELRRKYKNHPEFQFIFITDDRGSKTSYDSFVAKNLQGEASYRINTAEYNHLCELFHFNGVPHYELVEKDGSVMINCPSLKELGNYLSKRFGN